MLAPHTTLRFHLAALTCPCKSSSRAPDPPAGVEAHPFLFCWHPLLWACPGHPQGPLHCSGGARCQGCRTEPVHPACAPRPLATLLLPALLLRPLLLDCAGRRLLDEGS